MIPFPSAKIRHATGDRPTFTVQTRGCTCCVVALAEMDRDRGCFSVQLFVSNDFTAVFTPKRDMTPCTYGFTTTSDQDRPSRGSLHPGVPAIPSVAWEHSPGGLSPTQAVTGPHRAPCAVGRAASPPLSLRFSAPDLTCPSVAASSCPSTGEPRASSPEHTLRSILLPLREPRALPGAHAAGRRPHGHASRHPLGRHSHSRPQPQPFTLTLALA